MASNVPVATPQIAVAIAYPVVAQTAMDSLLPYDVFLVKQDSSILEMATSNAGCGCCEMSNKYAIYGIDANGQQKTLLLGQEDSSVLNRACCAPNHAFSMKFYETRGNSKAPNKTKGAVWTMEREGCCTKWLNCCPPIHACCQQEMKLYAGDVSGEVGKMEGTLIGRAEQPMPWGGCFTPTLHIMERDGAKEGGAKLEGPFIFGGCTELCMATEWPISKFGSLKKTGDLARITKQAPSTFKDGMKELLGDADIYTMHIAPGMNANQKAIFLASLILTDYMFFERDNGMFDLSPDCQTLKITCCLFYCCGVLCPFNCSLSRGSNEEGERE